MQKRRITLKTVVRDCLYLNWAMPARAVPPPPAPLKLEEHVWLGEPYVFVSALLFRHKGLQVAGLPLVRVSYPQLNLRLYARDGEGKPSVLLRCVMVPGWVAPSARFVARQPVVAGRFRYPRAEEAGSVEPRSWEVERRSPNGTYSLTATGRPANPETGAGPHLGSWSQTTAYFRVRRRGYVEVGDGLREARVSQPDVPVVPMHVEFREEGLLRRFLPRLEDNGWPALHSAWLCPEIPFVFELGEASERSPLPSSRASVAADPATFESGQGA